MTYTEICDRFKVLKNIKEINSIDSKELYDVEEYDNLTITTINYSKVRNEVIKLEREIKLNKILK